MLDVLALLDVRQFDAWSFERWKALSRSMHKNFSQVVELVVVSSNIRSNTDTNSYSKSKQR